MDIVTPKRWQKTLQLCEATLARPVTDRASFVTTACAGDELLKRDLESLLTQQRTLAGFPNEASVSDLMEDLPPGTRIGPYVVLDVLGAGGMGQVFLGNDTRLRRRVALKRLFSSPAAGEDVHSAIMREARAAARITHPNVAAVYDVLEHEGRAFIVMEYVEGESLATRLTRGRLPIDRVIANGRQLADALTAAHARGVIHSDLKPSNIHFAPDGAVKILDFGIARAVSTATASTRTSSGTTAITAEMTKIRAGTPAYMSPEQMMGHPLDGRSDVYSLGVVLYEMATGHRPFTTTDPLELIVALSKRRPRADRDDRTVPRALADVIVKATEIDLAARYQTAAELEAALGALQRSRQWPLWAMIVGAGVMLLALVTALGFVTTRSFEMGLDRDGVFRDSVLSWPLWGLRSMIAPAVYTGVVLVLIAVLLTIGDLVLGIAPARRLLEPVIARCTRWTNKITSASTAKLSELILLLQVAALGLFAWHFLPLISSFLAFQMQAPGWIGDLRPSNVDVHDMASSSLTLGIVAFSFAWYRLIRLRVARGERQKLTTVVAGLTALVLCLFFLSIRYRVLRHNRSERVMYGAETCYLVGTHGDEALVFCPLRFPRSLTVKTTSLTRTGVIENIFSPFDQK